MKKLSILLGLATLLSLCLEPSSLAWNGKRKGRLTRARNNELYSTHDARETERRFLNLGYLSPGEQFLPPDLIQEIASHGDAEDLRSHYLVNRATRNRVLQIDLQRGIDKVEKVEKLMEVDQYIPLSLNPDWADSKDTIGHVAVSQEVWVEVMENNPSRFKEEKYCPTTHTVVQIRGKSVEMCPMNPVENVRAASLGEKDSDEEFYDQWNGMNEKATRPFRYKRPDSAAWTWAARGGTLTEYVSGNDETDLWQYVSYALISRLDPAQNPSLQIPSPSGEHQTHGVKAKRPNELKFYRSSVSEWGEEMSGSSRVLRGGSWDGGVRYCRSAFRDFGDPSYRGVYGGVGFRLVRTRIP